MSAVVIESVSKSFDAVRAVDGLSACVDPGSVHGFLGPNGAGKTTAIRMLMNIIAPDSGRVEVFGRPAGSDVRERVGYMPEERGLYAKMKVADVLGYIGQIKGVSRADLTTAVPRWLDRVGLGDRAGRRVDELSRGMHQRLQFAATAINDPDLLILDEPFSGLDPVNLDQLKQIVLSMRDEGKTIIFSTHMIDEAERLCDSILLIDRGRKVLDGSLGRIRAAVRTNIVSAELRGDIAWLGEHPVTAEVRRDGDRVEITLAEDGDPQQLLADMVARNTVISFERKTPSLHELFLTMVGRRDENQ